MASKFLIALPLFNTYLAVSLFPSSYHQLLVAKYGGKREAKWRSTEEWRPVCEMERAMDVDLFLGAQDQWAKDSPHCLTILHKMFLHAAFEGQKEAEQVVHRGHQQHMPQPNLEAVPTIQLVQPETSRKELLDIYLEVYKLHRLPSSPPGELAILEEVSATVLDPSWEEEAPNVQVQPSHKSFHSSQIRTPHQQRETSMDRSLERVHEVHWKALSAAATLEEEIEKLHRMKGHFQLEVRPRSWDHWISEGIWVERHCQVRFVSKPTPSQSVDPDMPPSEMESPI